ncbi:MAG TPA: PIG-L family deacetylase [Kiritimatiellia bacterium]|nr:PIG-L family deacetylase [Kiritimatiellia bacterium]
MKLARKTAEVFVPDAKPVKQAIARTTHMCIAAHHDDIEIMAPHAILECFGRKDRWFTGVVATNGAGSPRAGIYAQYSDAQMRAVRREEQKRAAVIGEFGALLLLDHPSAALKRAGRSDVRADLKTLLLATRPKMLVIHNLTDKHDTHVALALRTIEALRMLPRHARPAKLYGGEVWRDLDWMLDEDKVLWDVSAKENVQAALLGVFDSQISGGKRYDLAAMARRRAHATYRQSHHVDSAAALSVGVDLTPLIKNDELEPVTFAEKLIDRFREDVRARIRRFL